MAKNSIINSVADEMAKMIVDYTKAKDYVGIYCLQEDKSWELEHWYYTLDNSTEVIGRTSSDCRDTRLRNKAQLKVFLPEISWNHAYALVYIQGTNDDLPTSVDKIDIIQANRKWYFDSPIRPAIPTIEAEEVMRTAEAADIIWTFLGAGLKNSRF